MSKSDIQIAREAKMKPIQEILDSINVPDNSEVYSPITRYIAKIKLEHLEKLKDKKDGKLILVTAISPTPAGEGKTTTTIGLGQALGRLGESVCLALREPSLGPCMGMKGLSGLNRAINHEAWLRSRRVSVPLANLAGYSAAEQVKEGRHFIAEHPQSSDLDAPSVAEARDAPARCMGPSPPMHGGTNRTQERLTHKEADGVLGLRPNAH